jgi:hypothetical protein
MFSFSSPGSVVVTDLDTGTPQSTHENTGKTSLTCSSRGPLLLSNATDGVIDYVAFSALPEPQLAVLLSSTTVIPALARNGSVWGDPVSIPHNLSTGPSAVPPDKVMAYSLSTGGTLLGLHVAVDEPALLLEGATSGLATLVIPLNTTCGTVTVQRLQNGAFLVPCIASNRNSTTVFYLHLQGTQPNYTEGTQFTTTSWLGVNRSAYLARTTMPSYVGTVPGRSTISLSQRLIVSRFYANVSQQRVFIATDPMGRSGWTGTYVTAIWHCMISIGGNPAPPITCAFSDPLVFYTYRQLGSVFSSIYTTALSADLDLVAVLDAPPNSAYSTAIRILAFPSYGNWTPKAAYEVSYTDPEPIGAPAQRINRNFIEVTTTRNANGVYSSTGTVVDLYDTRESSLLFMGRQRPQLLVYEWVPRLFHAIPAHGKYDVRINGQCAVPAGTAMNRAYVLEPSDSPVLHVAVLDVVNAGLGIRVGLVDARSGDLVQYADTPKSANASVTLYTNDVPPGTYNIDISIVHSAGAARAARYPVVILSTSGPIVENATASTSTRNSSLELLRGLSSGTACNGMFAEPCAALLNATGATSFCATARNEFAFTWCGITNTLVIACQVNTVILALNYTLGACNETSLFALPAPTFVAPQNGQASVPLFLAVAGRDPYDMMLFEAVAATASSFMTGTSASARINTAFETRRVTIYNTSTGGVSRAIALPTKMQFRWHQLGTYAIMPNTFFLVAVQGAVVVMGPMFSLWWPPITVTHLSSQSEVPVTITGTALSGVVHFLLETRVSSVSLYRTGRVFEDGELVFYDTLVATSVRDGSALGRNLIVYGGGTLVVPIVEGTASRPAGARVVPISGCANPLIVSADGMRIVCANATTATVVRLSFANTRRWNDTLPTGSALVINVAESDTPPFYNWVTANWFFNVPTIADGVPFGTVALPPRLPLAWENRVYLCESPVRYATYPYSWHCQKYKGRATGDYTAFPWLFHTTNGFFAIDVGIPDGSADGPALDVQPVSTSIGYCTDYKYAPFTLSPFCLESYPPPSSYVSYFYPPGLPRWRFPAMEARGELITGRIRMCMMEELRYACLLDERACLVMDPFAITDNSTDPFPSSYMRMTKNASVIAVSCDAAFWASLPFNATTNAEYAFWENATLSGQLTWLRPTLVRMSGSREAPVHEGNLPPLRNTLPLERDAVLDWTEACTADEGLCDNFQYAITCNVTVYRSRVDGITLFRKVQRVCPDTETVRRVVSTPVSASAAQSLCGPCWLELRDPLPRILYTGPNGTAIDPLSCGCSASCRPTPTDPRPCAAVEFPECSRVNESLYSAVRLCGPLALACRYTCSRASSTLAPVCSAVPGTCECTYPVVDRSRCLPEPETCSSAEMVTQCGLYAAECSVHRATPPVYNCTGLVGAPRSPVTGRFDAPIQTLSVSAPRVPLYSAANLSCLPWVDTASPRINLLRYFNCSWTDADVAGTGYACGQVADYASLCATAGIDIAVKGAGMVILDEAATFPAHDLPTRQVQDRASTPSSNLLPVASSAVNLAAFLQLSHGFIPEGAMVGIPQNVPVSDALLATVDLRLQNSFYKAFPDDSLPTVSEFRRAVPLKQNALAFRMRNVVPGGRYSVLYEHFLGGAPVSATDYRQWYTISAFLASGTRVSPIAVTSQTVSLAHEPVLGWTPAPQLRVDVPGVGAWATAPGETLDLNIVFSPLLPSEDDVLDCESRTIASHRSLGACRGATGVDPVAFRCVYAGIVAGQVPAWSVVQSCGLEFSQDVRGRLVRSNGTDLLLVRQLSLEPLWSTNPNAGLLAAWRTPSVVARIDFSDRLSVRSDGTPVPAAYVESARSVGTVFSTQPDARRSGTVLRVDASGGNDAWLLLSLAPERVALLRATYTKMAWVSTGDATVDLATGFANIFSDTLPSVYGVALNEGLFVLRGRLHCGTMRAPKRLLSSPAESLLQSASIAVDNAFFAAWRHVACTVSGTTATGTANYTLYVDGTARATATVAAEWSDPAARTMLSALHYIGAYNDVSGARRVLGLVDNVGLYDRALSADAILLIYAGGDPDGDGGAVIPPVQGVCLDGECGNQTVVLSERVFPIQLGFPLPIDDVGDRWEPLPSTFERPTFAAELVATYNWSMREAVQYVTTGAEFGVLGCLYQQFLLRADLNTSATCVGSVNGFPGALAGNYSGTASTRDGAFGLGVTPSNLMLGVTRNSSGSFTRVFGTSWALDADLTATSYPLLCTRASHAACGVSVEASPFPRPSTGHARLRMALSRAPLATRIVNVTNGVCFPVRVYGLDARIPGGFGGNQEGLGIASGFVLISVQCTTSTTGARFVARAECVQGTPDNITVVDSARASAVRGDTYLPRFALRHRVFANCVGTNCTGAVTWPNASTRLFTSLFSVDCGASKPLPSYTLACNRTEVETSCGPASTACLKTCVYNELETLALSTYPFNCTVAKSSCACPHYDAYAASISQVPCASGGTLLCTAAEAAAFGCELNHTLCRKRCTATGCSAVPDTCFTDIGVPKTAPCTLAEADATCGPHFNVPPTSAEFADATVWHSLVPSSPVVTDTIGWALSTDYGDISRLTQTAFSRSNCTVLRRTQAIFQLPILNYTFTCRAERMGIRPATSNAQDVSMVKGGLCMYTAGEPVFRINISSTATKYASTSFEQAATACDLDTTCAGLFLNGTWIWPMTGLPTNNTGNVTGKYYGRSNCNRCVSTRTRTGRTTWTTASVNCSCPRATPGFISASTAQDTVGYASSSASKLACACQSNYGITSPSACATACFPCTPAETSLYCSPTAGNQVTIAGTAGNANVPGAIQNASVCVRCPRNSIDTARALSCPGTFSLRRCNATEIVNHCGTSAVSCLLACPPTTGLGFPQRCRLWGRCGFTRNCTTTEARRLCGRYDPVGGRNPFLVRYGFYSGADGGASLAIPEGVKHTATAAAVSSCALREEQVDTGLVVTATRCNYSCPFFDTRYGICTGSDLSTVGACSRELEQTTCGFPGQVTSCRITAIGTVDCNCTAGFGPTPEGRCRGATRTATSDDLAQWIGEFGTSATLACEGGQPRDPDTASLLQPPPVPSFHFDFDAPVFSDRREQADGPITELRTFSANWGAVSNATFGAIQSYLRRGGHVLSIGAADAYTLSLPPFFAMTSFTLAFWMRPTGSIVNRSAVLSTSTLGRTFAIRMIADTVPNTYVLSVSVGNGLLLNLTEPSCAGCNRLNEWRHVVFSFEYLPTIGNLSATLYSNGTVPTVSVLRRTGVTQPGDWGLAGHALARCLARTTVPDSLIVKTNGTNTTVTTCRALCLFEGMTQMWHATTLCACGSTGAAWTDPVAPACNGVGADSIQTGLLTNGTIAVFDIYYLHSLAGRILLGPQTSVALDDIRVYNRAIRDDSAVRSIHLADRFASESVLPSSERCSVLSYACARNGFPDPFTGLPCGSNATRVLINTTETGATVFGRRAVAVHVLRYNAWERLEQPSVIGHASHHQIDLEGNVFIGRGNATNESLAVLVSICGANATSAELDVPMTTGGALRFDLFKKIGVTCTCAAGFFTDIQALGYSPADPIGTGPCVHRYRGTPCTAEESAALPWDSLQRDCRNNFRCWKRCETNGTCAYLMDQPGCTDRWIENATCSPLQAARLCPKSTISATLSSQIQWSCRGRCRYNGATLASQGASIQECSSVYACVGDAPDFSAVAPPDTSAQSGATLAYVVQTCAPTEYRDWCGTGAVGCTKRCAADGTFCYRFDTCACQTNPVNGTNATIATFASPCDGTTTNMADAIRSCGPFVRSYDRVECSAPGVCRKVCDCQPNTGRYIGSVRDGTVYLPCSGFTRPCEGPGDATERCQVARSKPNMAYASCSLRCAPAGPRNCTSSTCFCTLDPDTCVESGPIRRTVTVVRAGGIRAEIDASLVVLPNLSSLACTCAASQACFETNDAVKADCSEVKQPCRRLCVFRASNTNREFNAGVSGQCATESAVTGPNRVNFPTYPGPPIPVGIGSLGGGAIGEAVKSYLCATRCPTPSQHCDVYIRSRVDTCAYDPMLHVEVKNCYTDPPDRLATCDARNQWGNDPVTGGALRCTCASPNCGGCDGPNMTNASFCPAHPYAASGKICEQYCPAGTTDCVLTRIPYPNLTDFCGEMLPDSWGIMNYVDPFNISTRTFGICGRPFVAPDGNRVCGPGLSFSALRTAYPSTHASVDNGTVTNIFLLNTSAYDSLNTSQKSLLTKFYWDHFNTCQMNVPYMQLSLARFKITASCGRASLLPEQPDLSTGVITVGSITYRLRMPCSRTQAATYCGQAAVLTTDPITKQPPCWSVNGIVDINTCRCDPTKRGVQPSYASDISASPINNEPCVAEGSERECTSEEKDLYCGTGATVGCRMRAYAAKRDGEWGGDTLTERWLNAFLPEKRCATYTVRPSALGIIGLARKLLDRLPLNVTTNPAPPATMCIPRRGGFTDDLLLNHMHPTAGGDAVAELLTSVVPNEDLNGNWPYFGALYTTIAPNIIASLYFVKADNPFVRPFVITSRTVVNDQAARTAAQAECEALHHCGGWAIEGPAGSQSTLTLVMRPLTVVDAADLDSIWVSMPSGTRPLRFVGYYGWKMESDVVQTVTGGIEGPVLWHPVENLAERGVVDRLLPSGGTGKSASDWLNLREIGNGMIREVTPFLVNATSDLLYPEVSKVETAVYGVRFHRLNDLCRMSPVCCGISFIHPSQFTATTQDPHQRYAPAIIGYPCRATRTTHTFQAYGDKFLPAITGGWFNDGRMYRYGYAFAAKRTFMLKTRSSGNGSLRSVDIDAKVGKAGDLMVAVTGSTYAISRRTTCLTAPVQQRTTTGPVTFAYAVRKDMNLTNLQWIVLNECPGSGMPPTTMLAATTFTFKGDFFGNDPSGLATFYTQYLSGNMLRVADDLQEAYREQVQNPGVPLDSVVSELVSDWYAKAHGRTPGPFAVCNEQSLLNTVDWEAGQSIGWTASLTRRGGVFDTFAWLPRCQCYAGLDHRNGAPTEWHNYDRIRSLALPTAEDTSTAFSPVLARCDGRQIFNMASSGKSCPASDKGRVCSGVTRCNTETSDFSTPACTTAAVTVRRTARAVLDKILAERLFYNHSTIPALSLHNKFRAWNLAGRPFIFHALEWIRKTIRDDTTDSNSIFYKWRGSLPSNDPVPLAMVALVDAALDFIREAPFVVTNASTVPAFERRFVKSGVYLTSDNLQCIPDPEPTNASATVTDFDRLFARPSSLTPQSIANARATLNASILNLNYALEKEAPSLGLPPDSTTLPWNAAFKSLYFTTTYGPGLDSNLELTKHRCWNAWAPIRFYFDDVFPITYGANWNPLRNTTDLFAAGNRMARFGNPLQWLHGHSIQMKTMPLHKWHLFYKNLPPGAVVGNGMFFANSANGGIDPGDLSSPNGFVDFTLKVLLSSLPKWDDPDTVPSDWLGTTGPRSSMGDSTERAACRQARDAAFSTSVFADGGARENDTECLAFSCNCPPGRKGTACQYHVLDKASDADRNWDATRTARTRTYGISHYGTVCQSRKVETLDQPNSTNCGDVDTSGRAGCINGVWDWDAEKCICDAGWSRPIEIGEVQDGAFSDPSAWLSSTFYSAKFGPDIINPFYICIIPWVNASVPSCGTPLIGGGAACSGNETTCRPCTGRGVCLGTDGCRCNVGYYGRKCEYAVSTICDSLPDTSGIATLPVPNGTATPIQCSGHGSCEVRDISCDCGQSDIVDPSCCNITALCACVTTPGYGWSGVNCSQPYVVDPLGVSGGGCLNGGVMRAESVIVPVNTAVARGHRVWCECPREWTGTRCEISACPRGPNGLVCSGHGTCTYNSTTDAFSCKSRLIFRNDNSGTIGGMNFLGLNNTLMCMDPNGFSNENPDNPPQRWDGEACEIDTYQFCATRVGNSSWSVCGTTSNPADFVQRGSGCREVAGKPGVYRCDCRAYAAKKTGPLCTVDACIKNGDTTRCSNHPTRAYDVGGECVCRCNAEDWDITERGLTLSGLEGPFLGQYCERDVKRCRVAILDDGSGDVANYNATSNSWFYRNGTEILGGTYGQMYLCNRPGLVDPVTRLKYRGTCMGDGATARCVCARSGTPCADNTCESCLITDTDAPTGSPTSLPTVAVPPGATGQPTQNPTRAPTALVIPELPFNTPTGNNSCGGTPVARLFCGSSRRALEPIRVQRTGALANTTTTFRATPPFESIGLRLNTTEGIVTGTPNRSGVFRFTVRATIGPSASASALSASTYESLVTLSVEAPCPVACGANSIGCNTTTDAADGICVCRGLYSTNSSAAPCIAHPCLGAAFPDPQTATTCICADVRMSPLLGCNASGCPSAPNDDLCGVTIDRADLVVPGVDPAKECINSACICSFPYAHNASTGLCDALCDVNATRAVSNGACVCAADTPERRDPATGCTKPLCLHETLYDVPSQACACAFPFNGTACSLASPATRCECADCGFGVASCDPGPYNATCPNGSPVTCACPAVVEGARCQSPLCSRAHGSSIVSDGAGSWKCQCHASGVWGGRFCNESLCLNGGQPVWSTDAATWSCACPDGYDQTDLLCSGVCAAKAVKDPATGTCSCTFPNGGRYCEIPMCKFNPKQGRYTAGDPGFLPGSTACTCQTGGWWVGTYCNISRCGALGFPIRCPGYADLRTACGCTCIEGAAYEDPTQREKPGGFICQSIDGCASGTYNPETGGCSCGLSDPHCRNTIQAAITVSPSPNPTAAPTRSPANLPTVFTVSPSSAPTRTPTARPTGAPTSAVPTLAPTRTPTSAPTTSVPTAPPTGGGIVPEVCPGSAIACGSGGGSERPPADTPTGEDDPVGTTTPETPPDSSEPPNQISSGPRSSVINWAVVILPIIVAIMLADHDE